eukprot:Pgem_evm1s13325
MYPSDRDIVGVTLLYNDVGQCILSFDQIRPNQSLIVSRGEPFVVIDFLSNLNEAQQQELQKSVPNFNEYVNNLVINNSVTNLTSEGKSPECTARECNEQNSRRSNGSMEMSTHFKNFTNSIEYYLVKAENQIKSALDTANYNYNYTPPRSNRHSPISHHVSPLNNRGPVNHAYNRSNSLNYPTTDLDHTNISMNYCPPKPLARRSGPLDFSNLTPKELAEYKIMQNQEADYLRKKVSMSNNNNIQSYSHAFNNTDSIDITSTIKPNIGQHHDNAFLNSINVNIDSSNVNYNNNNKPTVSPPKLDATDSEIDRVFKNVHLETLSISKITLSQHSLEGGEDYEEFERRQYQAEEMRKEEQRREPLEKGHKAADRRSREKIRNNINDLKETIPASLFRSSKKTTKATIFQRVTEYMKFTLSENDRLKEENEEALKKTKEKAKVIKAEIDMLQERRCFPPAVFMFSAQDSKISFADHNFLLMCGFPIHEILGKKVDEIMSLTHQPLSKFAEHDIEEIDQGLKRIDTNIWTCLRGDNKDASLDTDKSMIIENIQRDENGNIKLDGQGGPWRGLCLLTTGENELIGFIAKCEPVYKVANDPN